MKHSRHYGFRVYGSESSAFGLAPAARLYSECQGDGSMQGTKAAHEFLLFWVSGLLEKGISAGKSTNARGREGGGASRGALVWGQRFMFFGYYGHAAMG